MENSNECKKNFVAVYDGSSAIEDLKVTKRQFLCFASTPVRAAFASSCGVNT